LKRLRILPQAVADLDTIWLHIARDDPDAADGIIDHFTERFAALCDFPHLGAACPEIAENLRRTPTRGYVIFYSVTGQTLVIERVLHGARDIEALFG
jgi:toxin ParE1/3/4